MRRRPAVVVLAALAAALALALAGVGCGGARSGLTPVEQNQLLGLIAQARSAAAAGNPTRALTTLTALRDRVSALRREGVLDPQRAAHMQSVAAQAQSAARAQVAAAAAPAPPVPPPAATTPAVPNPVQVIVQDAKGLGQRAQNALDKGAAKLREKLGKLGDGGGHGGEGG